MAQGRRSGRGPDYDWFGQTVSAALASGGVAIGACIAFTTQNTIMRVRGNYLVSMDGPVDNDRAIVGLGLIIVSDEALAAGVASVPTPGTDADAPWLWHQFVPLQAQAGTSVGASLNAMSVVARGEIDSRAMRRVKQNESIVMSMETTSLAGTPAVDIALGYRILTAA